MASGVGEMTIDDAFEYVKTAVLSAWSKTTRRVRAAGALLILLILCFTLLQPSMPSMPTPPTLPTIPTVHLDFHPSGPASPYNASKVALLIENRPNPILAPLLLHFITVVPPDWRFRFMGSAASIALVNSSHAIRNAVDSGKLDLTYIPANMTTGSQEEISVFLTTLWLYEVVLQPAEWLLVFQTDSMLCANSRQSLNEWLDYDWVGAPWNPSGRFGGNGGLSLRRVSAIIDVLKHQVRIPKSEPEDVWLTDRLGHRPGAHLANGTASLTFSGEMMSGPGAVINKGKSKVQGTGALEADYAADGIEEEGIDDWREGHYEPMGYHTGGSGGTLHGGIWGTPDMRKHIWEYCPEIKMMLQMDAARYVPGECNNNWKREEAGWEGYWDGVGGGGGGSGGGGGGEEVWDVIDGVQYPMLPSGLLPW